MLFRFHRLTPPIAAVRPFGSGTACHKSGKASHKSGKACHFSGGRAALLQELSGP